VRIWHESAEYVSIWHEAVEYVSFLSPHFGKTTPQNAPAPVERHFGCNPACEFRAGPHSDAKKTTYYGGYFSATWPYSGVSNLSRSAFCQKYSQHFVGYLYPCFARHFYRANCMKSKTNAHIYPEHCTAARLLSTRSGRDWLWVCPTLALALAQTVAAPARARASGTKLRSLSAHPLRTQSHCSARRPGGESAPLKNSERTRRRWHAGSALFLLFLVRRAHPGGTITVHARGFRRRGEPHAGILLFFGLRKT